MVVYELNEETFGRLERRYHKGQYVVLAMSRDGSEPFQAQAHLDDVGANDAFTVIWDHHVAQITTHYASA